MSNSLASITRLRFWELWPVTGMSFQNMSGIDPQFTRLTRNALLRYGGYLLFPFYLALAGRGYKVVIDHQIAGYAFLHLRQLSGIIFNVSVNAPFRRRGVAQQLMQFLEMRIQQQGGSWAALQVDRDNSPAVQLYEGRGYRPVFAQYWYGTIPTGSVAPGTAIEQLSASSGRHHFRHFLRQEIEAGEPWAAEVLQREFLDLPAGGRYFRCTLFDQEVGSAWCGSHDLGPAIHLALIPGYWGQITPLIPLLHLLVEQMAKRQRIQLALGSSAHHQQAQSLLQPFGFREETRDRLLMLKSLAG